MKILIFMFCLLNSIIGQPTIFEEYPTTCSLKSKKLGSILFTRHFRKVRYKNMEALFNLCDNIPEEYCGKNVKACVKKINTATALVTAGEFYRDEDANVLLTNPNSTLCQKPKLKLRLFCSDDMKEPRFIENGNCDYEIHLLKPGCMLPCTVWIYDYLKDFKALKGNYKVQNAQRNFSLSICQVNDDCNSENIAVCETSNGINTSISTLDSESIKYYENENAIKLHGSFKYSGSKNKPSKLEIILKCDWSKLTPQIRYIKPQIQGKKYTFEMLTYHGCIKKTPPDELYLHNFVYNFKPLAKNGHWSVTLPSQNQLLLNLYRPLLYPNNVTNHCFETSAQVCEINENKFINRGSIQTNFDILGDTVITTFESGDICNETTSEKYKTSIKFTCGSESGPQFVSNINCEIILMWITPVACPSYDNQSTCVSQSLPDNCTFGLHNSVYNLSSLSSNDPYIIKDESNNTLEYHLNICRPVMKDPCKKDVIVAVNHLNEFDIRKREISLGKFKAARYYNSTLVIEAASGAICKSLARDYSSLIYFECASNDEHPILKSKTDCTFEFTWRTKAACSNKVSDKPENVQCTFKHPIDNNKQINLSKLKNPLLKIDYDNAVYMFSICGQKSICDKQSNCYFATASNYLVGNNEGSLVYLLNKTCVSQGDFNKALIKLVCDPIVNNEHYVINYDISNCVITIQLWTNLVCSDKQLIVHTNDKSLESIKSTSQKPENFSNKTISSSKEDKVPSKQIVISNCSIINPYTNYRFNISELKLSIPSFDCPSYNFNYETNSVELIYKSHENCQSDSGQFKSYTVKMICYNSSQGRALTTTKNTSCQLEYNYESFKVCNLMEKLIIGSQSTSSGLGTGSIFAATFGSLLTIFVLSLLGFKYYKKYKKKSSYHHLQPIKHHDA